MFSAAGMTRHAVFFWSFVHYRALMIAWTCTFIFSAAQWMLSWRDRPWVTANIPLYNEDPELVDRCLYALLNQTRPADRIDVVDDGSSIGYRHLQQHWEGVWPGGTEIRWIRQRNAGKKHAQAATFSSDPAADIFITIDVNWLTRTVSARSLFFQIVACGAQSVCGDVLVNRGAYAQYRGGLIRAILPAYIEETFSGRPVKLGDDAALTLFARGRGRAVQQSSAFALTMYPETLGTLLCYAPAVLWATFVLRPLRCYGIATFLRRGWTTRTGGAEVAITRASGRAAA